MRVLKNGFFKGLGKFFKNSYFWHPWSPKVNAQLSLFIVTTPRFISPSGTMCWPIIDSFEEKLSDISRTLIIEKKVAKHSLGNIPMTINIKYPMEHSDKFDLVEYLCDALSGADYTIRRSLAPSRLLARDGR